MENFKFIVFSIVVFIITGLLGYWAVFTIQPWNIHLEKQKQQELKERNEELEEEVERLKNELSVLQSEQETPEPENSEPVKPAEKLPVTITYKYQSLITELQKLIDDNIFMKVGSRGTRVGTIQTFLNIYNKTSKRVDNDYGAGLKTDVMNFQKAVGITADGETGPSTYNKLIYWLKKQ